MRKQMRGSCHCGAIEYVAEVSFDDMTLRCNCTICTKARTWILPMEPARFTLLKGDESLGVYTFGERGIEHCFCSRCGIRTFGRSNGKSPMHPFVAISVPTLDLQPEEFEKFGITCLDGRHDSQEPPVVTSYL